MSYATDVFLAIQMCSDQVMVIFILDIADSIIENKDMADVDSDNQEIYSEEEEDTELHNGYDHDDEIDGGEDSSDSNERIVKRSSRREAKRSHDSENKENKEDSDDQISKKNISPEELLEMAYENVPDAKLRDGATRKPTGDQVKKTGGIDYEGVTGCDQKVSDYKSVLKNRVTAPETAKPRSKTTSDKPSWANQGSRRVDFSKLEEKKKDHNEDEAPPKSPWSIKLKSSGRLSDLENKKPHTQSTSAPAWATKAAKTRCNFADLEAPKQSRENSTDKPEWFTKTNLKATPKDELPRKKHSSETPGYTDVLRTRSGSAQSSSSSLSHKEEQQDQTTLRDLSPPESDKESEVEDQVEPIQDDSPDPVSNISPEPEPQMDEPPKVRVGEDREDEGAARSRRSRRVRSSEDDGEEDQSAATRRSRRANEEEEGDESQTRSSRRSRRSTDDGGDEGDDDASARRRARRARRRGAEEGE